MTTNSMPPIVEISFAGRPIAKVQVEDLPIEISTEIFWQEGDRFLDVIDQDRNLKCFDFAVVPLEEASGAALSIRISATGALQADCLLGKDTVPSTVDFMAGTVAGIRLQPLLLPGVTQTSPIPKGQGLFVRGLHYPGVVTRSNVSLLCLCDDCGRSFRLQSFHSGFSHSEYYYCGTGVHTLVLEASARSQLSTGASTNEPTEGDIESALPRCQACSQPFRYLNPLRCPYCFAPYIDFTKFPEARKIEYYGNVLWGIRPQYLAAQGQGKEAPKIVARPAWGTLIIEDMNTHEVSLQCLGGGFAMYWHRVVLTPDEAAALREGHLDIGAMVRQINGGTGQMAKRILPGYDVEH